MRHALPLFLLATQVWAQPASPEKIREAATRAVALIQSSQKAWPAKQSCHSCHHQFQPAIAFRTAREHGIPIDETIARTTDAAAFRFQGLDEVIQYQGLGETATSDAYALVAAHAAGVQPNLYTAVTARLIAGRQARDGDWTSLHTRPPSAHSSFMMTAVGLHSLQLYGHPSQRAEMDATIARARAWLAGHTPRDTEDRVFQLRGLHWAGTEKTLIEKPARALKGAQQADGGWNALDGRASDVYSTGETLIALLDAGQIQTSDKAYQRGIAYLLKTQASDGSWHVRSRLNTLPISPPYFESGYPYGHDQFISVHGSSWAVMALARALGSPQAAAPRVLDGVAPVNVEPWVEKVMFGSVADLKKLLDGGFDPNSATRPGGTTALMAAAPDLEKMKLLLDRGAKINTRAKSKYSALMVAAQYTNAAPTIQFLLSRGAEVRLPKGEGAPKFNAHPLYLAAYAGNTEALAALKAAGDRVDNTMLLFGILPTTALGGAVMMADLPVVRELLNLGAPVNQASAGMTPLKLAIFGHAVEIARLLIERGADVNQADGTGWTPLQYAAATDFGDAAMVELLLQSGASRDARNKAGLTASEIAKKLRHDYSLAKLQ